MLYKKFLFSLFIVLLSFFIQACESLTDDEQPIDYNQVEVDVKSTVLKGIVKINSFAFGVIINKEGNKFYVVGGINAVGSLNTHTISDYNGNEYEAFVEKKDRAKYLVLMSFESDSDLAVLSLSQTPPEQVHDILSIGNNNAVYFGIAEKDEYNSSLDTILFSHNAQSNTLNNSAIVFDFSGLVVGIEIASSKLVTNNRSTRFGVSSISIRDFI
ncbi:MAG TPA: hypothetical protein PLP48_06585 [Acholeplasmataceae bacterium]|nr:hypothetical protein [Acholeplasmataceae bacterium]